MIEANHFRATTIRRTDNAQPIGNVICTISVNVVNQSTASILLKHYLSYTGFVRLEQCQFLSPIERPRR